MVLINEEVLRVVRMSDNAFLPTKATPDAAGFDLYRYKICFFVKFCH